MGRKSALTDKQWAEKANKLLGSLMRADNNEEMAVIGLKVLLLGGDAERVLGCNKIERYRFEVSIGLGRVDLVLFHKDGGISLVEVKADSDLRSVCGGIGQLFMYEAELPLSKFGNGIKPKYVNKILASPLSPEKAAKAIRACSLAGVKYVCVARHSDVKEAFAKVYGVNHD